MEVEPQNSFGIFLHLNLLDKNDKGAWHWGFAMGHGIWALLLGVDMGHGSGALGDFI